jgi:hypothetical protein
MSLATGYGKLPAPSAHAASEGISSGFQTADCVAQRISTDWRVGGYVLDSKEIVLGHAIVLRQDQNAGPSLGISGGACGRPSRVQRISNMARAAHGASQGTSTTLRFGGRALVSDRPALTHAALRRIRARDDIGESRQTSPSSAVRSHGSGVVEGEGGARSAPAISGNSERSARRRQRFGHMSGATGFCSRHWRSGQGFKQQPLCCAYPLTCRGR